MQSSSRLLVQNPHMGALCRLVKPPSRLATPVNVKLHATNLEHSRSLSFCKGKKLSSRLRKGTFLPSSESKVTPTIAFVRNKAPTLGQKLRNAPTDVNSPPCWKEVIFR